MILANTAFTAEEPNFVPGEILVQFKQGTSLQEIEYLENRHRLIHIRILPSVGIHHYRLPSVVRVEDAVALLQTEPIVEVVEPNFLSEVNSFTRPTDPNFHNLWYLENTGQVVNGIQAVAGFDIDWLGAMEIYSPKEKVIVGVLDTGAAFWHPIFWSASGYDTSLWINDPEMNGESETDDDNNGYIDDRWGFDFVDYDNVPEDYSGHGTHCASIIGGVMNNGIPGVGISPDVEIMTLRVGNSLGQVSTMAWITAMDYASKNGASILNCSFGGAPYSELAQNVIYLMDSRDVFIVFSVGNACSDNDEVPVYPSCYYGLNVIRVAATDPQGNLSCFSNYGKTSVDIAAPGSSIYGASISRSVHYSEDFDDGADGWTTYPLPDNQSTYEQWGFYEYEPGNFAAADSVNRWGGLAYYKSNTHTAMQSPLLNLEGLKGPVLKFDVAFRLEYRWELYETDMLFVEVSTDGLNWDTLHQIYGSGTDTQTRSVRLDLSDYVDESVYVRFRLKTDELYNYQGICIDNFEISWATDFEYSGSEHQFMDGTSFAAPIVTGVSTLVLAHRPDLKPIDLRMLIFLSAYMEPHESLEGKMRTEGIVNARSALEMACDYSMTTLRFYLDSVGLGCDYYKHQWLQYMSIQDPFGFNDWIYQYSLGWLYTLYDTDDSCYFYSPDSGWFWMHKSTAPYYYSMDQKNWFYWTDWIYAR